MLIEALDGDTGPYLLKKKKQARHRSVRSQWSARIWLISTSPNITSKKTTSNCIFLAKKIVKCHTPPNQMPSFHSKFSHTEVHHLPASRHREGTVLDILFEITVLNIRKYASILFTSDKTPPLSRLFAMTSCHSYCAVT